MSNSPNPISTKNLRELVSKSQSAKMSETALSDNFVALADNILRHPIKQTHKETSKQLTKLYNSVANVFDYAEVPEPLRKQRFISKTGMAMSPEHALHTVKDVFRVSGFIRGIHAAIRDLKRNFPEKAHIVYPACGPMAPLILPLLMYYKQTGEYTANDFHITFIDIQEGAVLALKEILHVGGLDPFVKDVLHMDAVDYQTRPHEDVHMVLLEAIQHGLTREGQLAISLHFAKLLHPKGIFIPENVSISTFLANPEVEFIQRGKIAQSEGLLLSDKCFGEDRMRLGDILHINLQSLSKMEFLQADEYTRVLTCGEVTIPELEADDKNKLMLFRVEVDIYGGERVNEYESGITHPLPDRSICINFEPRAPMEDDLVLFSGDTVRFFYRMNGEPGFFAVKVED